jgi:uncharacterized damage-inducible protein DinB
MQPTEAHAVLKFLIPIVELEHETTKRVIAAVPEGQEEYRPDPVSKTALELASHIAESEVWFLTGAARGEFPAYGRGDGDGASPFEKAADVLAWYEQEFPKALAEVKRMTPEQAAKTFSMFGRFTQSAIGFISLALRHSAHHRGQLSAYLRSMGSKVPSIYGDSADTKAQQATA